MLKLLLQADRKSEQALKKRLPPIIDGIEPLTSADLAGQLFAWSSRDRSATEADQCLTVGIVMESAEDTSREALQSSFPGQLETDSVFVLPPRVTDFSGFEAWCAARVKRVLDVLLGQYVASQLATASLRRHTEQLERSLEQAEAVFTEFRREPLKLAYRTERAGTYALPLMGSNEGGQRSLEVNQTLRRHIPNIRYIDVFFNGDGRNLEGTIRFTARGAWSEKVLCDASIDVKEIGPGWTRFKCDPLESGDEEPLVIELHLSGSELGWIAPAFSHPSPVEEECATIAGYSPIGRPLAMQIWSGIAGIEAPAAMRENGQAHDAAAATILAIASEQLGMAEMISKLPPALTFSPVSYDGTTQSLLVHPLGTRPTVVRLPSLTVSGLSSLSAIVQLRDANAQPTEFGLFVSPAADRGRTFNGRSTGEDIDLASVAWHKFNAREWGEIELNLPAMLDGDIHIYLLTRTLTENYNYTSAWFRGLRMTCRNSIAADRFDQQ